MRPVLARADAAGHPVYLETHREANVRFYGRHGFEMVGDDVVDGLRVWGLRRLPTHVTSVRRHGGLAISRVASRAPR